MLISNLDICIFTPFSDSTRFLYSTVTQNRFHSSLYFWGFRSCYFRIILRTISFIELPFPQSISQICHFCSIFLWGISAWSDFIKIFISIKCRIYIIMINIKGWNRICSFSKKGLTFFLKCFIIIAFIIIVGRKPVLEILITFFL